jgi:hypothetical protein
MRTPRRRPAPSRHVALALPAPPPSAVVPAREWWVAAVALALLAAALIGP